MKDRFEHILQEKLQDYSMKAESRDWDVLQRSLGLEQPKRVPLYRYVAAAAVLLLLVAGGFYLSRTVEVLPDGTPVATVTDPVTQNPIGQIGQPAGQSNEALDAALKIKETIERSYGRTGNSGNNPNTGTQIVQYPTGNDPVVGTGRNTGQPGGQSGRNTTQDSNPTRGNQGNSSNTAIILANNDTRLRSNRRNANWALSLFADGSGNGGNGKNGEMVRYNSALDASDLMTMRSSGSLIQQEYDEKTGLLKTEVGEWKHDLPLTFGLMVRHNFNEFWGIETGLTYSYLSSKQEVSSVQLKQKLHYLGVPLAVTYTPFRTKNFEFYGRLGGAADFNIAGKKTVLTDGNQPVNRSFTKSGVQWSASANLGAMYNISPVVGIYLEPGVSHYFEFSNQPDHYWKEHPTNFNLKIGIRTNF